MKKTYVADCLCWIHTDATVHIKSPTGKVVIVEHKALIGSGILFNIGVIIKYVITNSSEMAEYNSVKMPFTRDELEELLTIGKLEAK